MSNYYFHKVLLQLSPGNFLCQCCSTFVVKKVALVLGHWGLPTHIKIVKYNLWVLEQVALPLYGSAYPCVYSKNCLLSLFPSEKGSLAQWLREMIAVVRLANLQVCYLVQCDPGKVPKHFWASVYLPNNVKNNNEVAMKLKNSYVFYVLSIMLGILWISSIICGIWIYRYMIVIK